MSDAGTLHILPRSPTAAAWRQCQAVLRNGDSILLIEDGVYTLIGAWLDDLPADARCYALLADCQARGISGAEHRDRLVDDSGFVELVIQHARNVTWA